MAAASILVAPAASDPTRQRARDLRLDFFRGLALFFIFVDHIPGNTLGYFTLHALGFSDAAEIFIFISGYTAALVYGRSMLRHGALFATAQIYRRVWQLYVAHVFIFVIFTAEVSYSMVTFNSPIFSDELRVGDFLAEPHIAIVKALLLQFQPTFLDILPLYIVLLASFPVILLLLRRHWAAALLPALALYVAAHLFGWSLPGYPAGHVWFFNPLDWQLLFVIGACGGFAEAMGRPALPGQARLVPLAAAFVLIALIVNVSWTIHGVWDSFPALLLKQLWPINKSNLAGIRIVHFLALAIVAAHLVPADSRLLRQSWARPLILCGQQSLHVFCLGILLSVLAHFVLSEWSDALPAQLAVNGAGFALMIGTAWLLAWYRAMNDGAPPRARPSHVAEAGAAHRTASSARAH